MRPKTYLKNILLGIFFLTSVLIFPKSLSAEDRFTVYFFYSYSCPHCAKEEVFLEKLEKKYSFLEIKKYEVTKNYGNSQLLKKAADRLGVEVQGVPFTIVHDQTFIGYYNDETTGTEIEKAITELQQQGCEDPLTDIFSASQGADPEDCQEITPPEQKEIDLPLIGRIDIGSISLPLLTVLIAAVDGFNPCAMWILLFLISLLLGMEDRKKMWLLGGIFIMASAFSYFLFLSAWLSLFLFLGLIFWVRLIIGLVAVGSGAYHLQQFWTNRSGACPGENKEKKKKMFSRIKNIIQNKNLVLVIFGIVLLAFSVNIIELACSAGLPAVYAQILALSGLSRTAKFFYLLLYVLIFMLDDLVVFWVAMTTLNAIGISSKFKRYSNLIGGIIIIVIGILLITKPEWLVFG